MAADLGTQESLAQAPAATKTSAKKATAKKKSSKKTPRKRAKKTTAKKSIAKKKRPAKKVAKKAVAKKSAPKKRKTKPVAQITKAQAIRDSFNALGKKARPKDIIAALAEKGITVTSPQVSMTLKAAGLRKGRRRQKVLVQVAAKSQSPNDQMYDINDLVQVKKLAKELGGTAMLKELAESLERLL